MEDIHGSTIGAGDVINGFTSITNSEDLEIVSDDSNDGSGYSLADVFVDAEHDSEHHRVGESASSDGGTCRLNFLHHALPNDEVSRRRVNGKQESE